MILRQVRFTLKPKARGFHLVTREVLEGLGELAGIETGLCHLFLQHTSASLTLNENSDPAVRQDFEGQVRRLAPDAAPHYRHTLEGPDDLPAHLKASLFGAGLSIPIAGGRLALGTWQGIYLGEHREHGGPRRVVATLLGEPAAP
jgi:secondary thiamine-phosphate synthase enzyme